MKTFTIEQKMSSTGSIYDLASDQCDRVIKFPKSSKYAVVLPSYYGGKGYTTHKTQEAAKAKAKELSNKGYHSQIIDSYGNYYDTHDSFYAGNLVRRK